MHHATCDQLNGDESPSLQLATLVLIGLLLLDVFDVQHFRFDIAVCNGCFHQTITCRSPYHTETTAIAFCKIGISILGVPTIAYCHVSQHADAIRTYLATETDMMSQYLSPTFIV